MKIIDIHTHAFPDSIAERAMESLNEGVDAKAKLDGRISSLLASMDAANVDISIVASIATRPKQYAPILEWSKTIASERLIPFPSVHPSDPEAAAKIRHIASEGFLGIKLHPYYQEFDLLDDRMFPIYEAVLDSNLALLMHTGFDPAFKRNRIADPVRISEVSRMYPSLKLITTHTGAWEDWDEVRRYLIGKPVYMDLSYSVEFMEPGFARSLLEAHPAEYLLLGTDSPWSDPRDTITYLRNLQMGHDWEALVLGGNAMRLLNLS